MKLTEHTGKAHVLYQIFQTVESVPNGQLAFRSLKRNSTAGVG